jgi:hypothetical protein
VGGNGSGESVGAEKAVAVTVRRWSARSGHRLGREADNWGPRGFVFLPNYINRLKLET